VTPEIREPKPVSGRGEEEKPLVLIVEDDPDQRVLFQHWLGRAGYDVRGFGDGESLLMATSDCLPDAVCLDLHLPGLSGLETLRQLRSHQPRLPVVMLTADADVDLVVESMRLGALNYLVKPADQTRLTTEIRNAVERGRMEVKLAQLEREVNHRGFAGMAGESPVMRELFRQLERVAPTDVSVLLHGESGTGKELAARALHANSGWKKGPFVALNCAAIPETLQEAEIFGHERGAFTGALSQKIGRFEEADGGTLFLDEIAEMSPALQAKLLRVVQEKVFRRVGGSRDIESRFRLIAATHRDLAVEVAEGRFREDLFYRVAVFEVEIPPLRERRGDLPLLADVILQGLAEPEVEPLSLSGAALEALEAYDWPGNVRELQNALQRASVLANGSDIDVVDLPARVVRRDGPGEEESDAPQPADSARAEASSSLDDLERAAIEKALERCGGNLSEAARRLGIGRTTLYRKLVKYGLREA
jgi:DNA-binding NtrC family response regulator